MAQTPSSFTYGGIFRLTIPMLASFLLEMLIGMTDIAFLGRYGETELAASALSGVYFLTLLMLGLGYSWGAQAYMAQTNGEGNKNEIGLTFQQSNIFLTGLSLVLIAFSFLVAPGMFDAITTDPGVRDATVTYLLWRSVGLPFAFICATYRAFYVATLRPRVITYSSIVMVAVNCVLNYLLIFGIGPFPELGIAGAAIASAVSEVAALIYFYIYAKKYRDIENYFLSRKFEINKRVQGILFRLGRWMMLQEIVQCSTWLIFFVFVEHLGKEALALSNVLRQLTSLLYLVIHAFGSTCGAICANLIGEERREEILPIIWKSFVLCIASVAVCEAIALISPAAMMSIFTDIDAIKNGPYTTYYIMLGSFVVGIPAVFAQFVFSGMGYTKISSLGSLVAVGVYTTYTCALAYVHADINAMWTTDYIYYVGMLAVMIYYFKQKPWLDPRSHG